MTTLDTAFPVLSFLSNPYVLLPVRFISSFLLMKTLLRFLPIGKGRWRYLLLYASCFLIVTLPIIIGDSINIVAGYLFFLVCVLVCCKERPLARATVATIFFTLASSFNAVLFELTPHEIPLFELGSTVLWLGAMLSIRKILPEGMDELFHSTRTWILTDALALMPFACTMAVVCLTELTPLSQNPDPWLDRLIIHNRRAILTVLCFAVFASLVQLFALAYFARSEKVAAQQFFWQSRNQYYQNLEQTQAQVRRLRHDMANHFTAMAGMDDDAMRRYLNRLVDSPAMKSGRRYCENEAANVVISAKAQAMEEQRILLETELELPAGLPIEDADLCALFANCLDNAMEAAQKLPPDQRRVQLTAKASKGMFALEETNPANGPLLTKKGRIQTTKADKRHHGLGLASMEEIARRYGGTLEAGAENGTFRLCVFIPLPQDTPESSHQRTT